MESVVRTAVVYLFLLIVLRLTGKRTLGEISTYDLVLLLIISEATQQGMIGSDYSVTNSFVCILTLVCLDLMLGYAKQRWHVFETVTEGLPLILVEHGKPIKEHLDKSVVDEDDILEAARATRGLERMDQIKYAVQERNGDISIIPRDDLRLKA
ncbi:MAG: DUF421 domain-containing protein [Bacteroidota bacterium]